MKKTFQSLWTPLLALSLAACSVTPEITPASTDTGTAPRTRAGLYGLPEVSLMRWGTYQNDNQFDNIAQCGTYTPDSYTGEASLTLDATDPATANCCNLEIPVSYPRIEQDFIFPVYLKIDISEDKSYYPYLYAQNGSPMPATIQEASAESNNLYGYWELRDFSPTEMIFVIWIGTKEPEQYGNFFAGFRFELRNEFNPSDLDLAIWFNPLWTYKNPYPKN